MKRIPVRSAILSLVLFLIIGGCSADPQLVTTGSPAGSELALAAKDCPPDAFGVAVLVHPGRFLADVRDFLDTLPIPALQPERAKMQAEAKNALGLDPLDAAAWRDAGFDLDQPLRAELRGWPGRKDPSGIVISAGVADAEKVLKFIGTLVARDHMTVQPSPDKPSLYRFMKSDGRPDSQAALVMRERRMVWLAWDARTTTPDPLAFLDRPVPGSLADDPAFRAVAQRLHPDTVLAVFANLKLLWRRAADPDIPPLLRELDGAGLGLHGGGGETVLAFRPDAGILALLQPGTGNTGLLQGLTPFLFRLSVSVADPVGLARHIAQQLAPPAGMEGPVSPYLRELNVIPLELAGMSNEDFRAALLSAHLGLAFGLPAAGAPVPRFIVLAACKDDTLPAQAARFIGGKAEFDKRAAGEATIYFPRSDPRKALGIRGRILTLGDDPAWQEKVLESAGTLHPAVDSPGDRLASSELSAGEMLLLMMPRNTMENILPASLLSDGSLTMTHTLRRSGSCLVLEHGGRSRLAGVLASPVALAAAVGIPMFLRLRQDVTVTTARVNLRLLATSEASFFLDEGRYVGFPELVRKGLLGPEWDAETPVNQGFRYSITIDGDKYRIIAHSTGQPGQLYVLNETGTVFTDEACTKPYGE